MLKAKDESGAMKEQGPFRIVHVEFESAAGSRISARLKSVPGSGVAAYPAGAAVPIEYDPRSPERIAEAGFLARHGLKLFLGIFGAGFLLSALLVARLAGGDSIPGSMTLVRIAAACVCLGALLAGLALWSLAIQRGSGGSEIATATVTGYESVKSTRAHYQTDEIYPVLQFETSRGRVVTARSQTEIDLARDAEGARYRVKYSKKDPSVVRPVTSDASVAGSVFVLFVALFPLGFGGSWLLQMLRR
ncbi:MAG: DUF3592 domain-containing protein [Myxococcales bacterium]